VLPSVNSTLDLSIFATTNIFAPGKHFINVSGPSDVYTPYDVLILGQLVDNIAPVANAIVPTSSRLLADHADVLTGLGGSTQKTTQEFVTDLAMGRPILAKALAALQTGDQSIISNFAQQEGYALDDAQISSAVSTSHIGPDFDIRAVAGLYGFDEPADLTSTKLVVDPSTARYGTQTLAGSS